MVCNTSAGVTPQLRSEGYTELAGDIVITCSGGAIVAPSTTALPQTNIVVSLNTQVTSRLLSTATSGVGYPSEAILMIDEPTTATSGVATGFGPGAALVACTPPLTGCNAYGLSTTVTGGTATVVVAAALNGSSLTAATAAPNLFQGVVNGNQITFYGVPVLPPGTSGYQRVYRITNVRANAQYLGPASSNGVSSLTASISTNGSTSLPLSSSTVTVGYIQAGLSVKTGTARTFQQCVSAVVSGTTVSTAIANTLTYSELFGTAFKTRVAPLSNIAYAAQAQNLTGQQTPGNFTYSESGFIYTGFTANTNTAYTPGLSDYGTRLKAVFSNIPSGMALYVTSNNMPTTGALVPNVTSSALVGGTSTAAYAVLVPSETTIDGSSFSPLSGTYYDTSSNNLYALTVSGGAATAVWEVTNAGQNTIDSLVFGVYGTYTASAGTSIPTAPITATVNMSYAPTWGASGSPFTASAAAVASYTLPIVRFNDNSSALTLLKTAVCQTALLWPYVTNWSGFDTGLAISNTSSDPWGTTAQTGTCTLNFYGTIESTGSATVAAYTFPNAFAPTTKYQTQATNIQTVAPGFQGYVIGVCNFQYAHGYGVVTDVGVRNLMSGYLALVMSNGDFKPRFTASETFTQ